MPQIAALTINDGQTTPVAHTFAPVRVDSEGVAKYEDRVSGIAIGFPTISLSLKDPVNKQTGNYKVMGKIAIPVLEQTTTISANGINPQPTVAYTLFAEIRMTIPARSLAVERANLQAYCENLLSQAVTRGIVKTYDPVY